MRVNHLEPLRPDVAAEQRGGDPDQAMTSEPEMIAARVDRFRHRHRFWTDRVAELTRGPGQSDLSRYDTLA